MKPYNYDNGRLRSTSTEQYHKTFQWFFFCASCACFWGRSIHNLLSSRVCCITLQSYQQWRSFNRTREEIENVLALYCGALYWTSFHLFTLPSFFIDWHNSFLQMGENIWSMSFCVWFISLEVIALILIHITTKAIIFYSFFMAK